MKMRKLLLFIGMASVLLACKPGSQTEEAFVLHLRLLTQRMAL